MRKSVNFLGMVMAGLLSAMPAQGDVSASQPSEIIRLRGKIEIVSAQGPRITAATISEKNSKKYNLEMDSAGEDLARVMFGQSAFITGVVSERDGEQWLKVKGFAENKFTAAHELWRRSRCNACAAQNGAKHSAEPADLHGATAVVGRLYPGKQEFRSTTRDSKYLWLATDNLIYQVDLAKRTLVKTYDQTTGWRDQPLMELASDERTLWILSRGSAYALPIGQDKAVVLPQINGVFSKLCVTKNSAWIIADNGTYRYSLPSNPPEVFPALPTGRRMATEIGKGMWLPFWKQNTSFYMARPLTIGDSLFVGSFGDLYELSAGTWRKIISGGSQQQVQRGHLWALAASGVVEYNPLTQSNIIHMAKEIADGRLTGMLATDTEIWVTVEPTTAPTNSQATGGGLGRMELSSGQWKSWKTIDGMDAGHSVVHAGQDGTIWVAAHQGQYKSLAAHPGMTYVEKTLFAANHFSLHRWDASSATWQTTSFAYHNVERRYICGQDGQGSDGDIGPQTLESLCVGTDRVFAITHLMPEGNFSGFWPCVNQIATRAPDGKWTAAFDHHPHQLGLQGEQPLVLNISNKGEMFLKAVGHDDVLELFQTNGIVWAISEGMVGWFDSNANTWRSTVELGFNFYWRPTAILDEGNTVFVGSDRGWISLLDLKTGQFQIIGGLKDRRITKIVRQDGHLTVFGEPAPLGQLPVRPFRHPDLTDAAVAMWDGHAWSTAASLQSEPATLPSWQFLPLEKPKKPGTFLRDQAIGNMLWGPASDGKLIPRFYVKEVYAPRFLDFGNNGQRMWASTFSGLLKVDLPAGRSAP